MRLDNHSHETFKRAFAAADKLEAHGLVTSGFRTQEMADGSCRTVTFVDAVDQHGYEVTIRVIAPAPAYAPSFTLGAQYQEWTTQILDGKAEGWQELRV